MLPPNNSRMIALLDQLGLTLKTNKGAAQVAEIFGFDARTVRRWPTNTQSSSTVPLCAVKLAEALVAQNSPHYLVFAWDKKPAGGWKDFKRRVETLDEAITCAERRMAGFHIVEASGDLRSHKIIG